jgi:gamma-glutamyltranspeptidase/glutathione hydrolase
VTSTVESAFGSGLSYRGFYLNNELTDFAFVPTQGGRPVANAVAGGKRPASSMSPTVVYDPQGRPFLSIGAAGGGLIPVQTARAIVGVIDFHLPVREALGLPFVMDVGKDTVLVEKGTWMEALGPEFVKLGHANVVPFDQLLRTTGALRTSGGWVAAFDPRLDPLVAIPATPRDSPVAAGGFSEGQ